MKHQEKVDLWYDLSHKLAWLQQFFAGRFKTLAPGIYNMNAQQMAQHSIPGFGSTTFGDKTEVFAGNIATTYRCFQNVAHLDNDFNMATLICSCLIN
jgi:hypothetical protein